MWKVICKFMEELTFRIVYMIPSTRMNDPSSPELRPHAAEFEEDVLRAHSKLKRQDAFHEACQPESFWAQEEREARHTDSPSPPHTSPSSRPPAPPPPPPKRSLSFYERLKQTIARHYIMLSVIVTLNGYVAYLCYECTALAQFPPKPKEGMHIHLTLPVLKRTCWRNSLAGQLYSLMANPVVLLITLFALVLIRRLSKRLTSPPQ
ncbi:hypothetical protein BCR43DRAFT_489208 [Syncephalastrum racemosum]|uniref:Uncharacterized protein n=1 Tax=Syncephalastrum racemosum TaxID=13706 RepID=A0A1X2HJW8_SYNRA|nr:hypothetical protein BCR43DRAFT_489208 [Syncephalastrum racemosum]